MRHLDRQHFRTRIVAEGLSPQTPTGDVVSPRLITIQSDASIYEAMLTMRATTFHHLPVLYRQRPMAWCTFLIIIRYETHNGLYLGSNIFHQSNVEGLARLAPDVSAAFVRMVQEGATRTWWAVRCRPSAQLYPSSARARRGVAGSAAVDYCFMVNGSMARNSRARHRPGQRADTLG